MVHDAHDVSEVTVHAEETYWPVTQALQSAQEVELAAVEKLSPAWHEPQLVLAEAEQFPTMKDPAPQMAHVWGWATPPVQKFGPEGHGVTVTPLRRYWPGLAEVPEERGHELLPASDVVPAEHAAHTLEPVPAANDPAAHEVHDVVALFAYAPSGHRVHPALVADGTQ